MSGPDQAPTRAALVALRDERSVVGEAYDFLDEKRLLLAAELLRQLERYERLQQALAVLAAAAGERLRGAVKRHGLQGISVYPARPHDGFRLQTRQYNFMGVMLADEAPEPPEPPAGDAQTLPVACNPSHEAEACRSAFREIFRHSAALAVLSGNLHRLLFEYRLTERRARALENIILPELEQALATLTTRLEEMDLEDVTRAHRYGMQRQGG